MIAHLAGVVFDKRPDGAIIDVHGVGYRVLVSQQSAAALPALGAAVSLRIYTHVREDALQLYGFATAAEESLFEHLISVSGVGPKLALTILSGMPAEELAASVASADAARLTKISGVGKKTAERLIVELKDKVRAGFGARAGVSARAASDDDLVSALVNLGYRPLEAERAAASARKSSPKAALPDLLREALKAVAR